VVGDGESARRFMAGVGALEAAAMRCAGVGFGGIDGDGVGADVGAGGAGAVGLAVGPYVGASVGWRVGFAVGETCG